MTQTRGICFPSCYLALWFSWEIQRLWTRLLLSFVCFSVQKRRTVLYVYIGCFLTLAALVFPVIYVTLNRRHPYYYPRIYRKF